MRASRRSLAVAWFVGFPALVVGMLVSAASRGGRAGFDYAIFRAAGADVGHGHSPYLSRPTLALLSQDTHFVYPTPFALPFVPFALISERVGAVLFLLLSAAAVVGALRLLDVRDWRLYGLVLSWPAAFSALGLGTLGPALLLAVAAGWRFRRSSSTGAVLAVAAAAKLFLWPVLVWLIVTRRWKAAAVAGVTLLLIAVLWACLDPSGLLLYPKTVRLLELGHPNSYSPRSLLIALGVPGGGMVPGLFALGGVVVMWLRRGDDRAAFATAVITALLTTPILWLHYLVLLAVPLALYRRRLGWQWFVPLVLWVTPTSEPRGRAWRMALALAVTAAAWAGAYSSHSERRLRPGFRLALPPRAAGS